ncbi:hypothetical protein MNBD_ALPHA07-315 [hydrothermal vent metagenome]|uniref:Uncharacterized protein n=1 Tax=hydrothermal vent metagenome TaxID=652676 RepID=A0A3B0RKX9_9ZZZZ
MEQSDTNQGSLAKDEMAILAQELHQLNQHRFVKIHNSPLRLIMFQFFRGLAFGLGSVIGATILFSMLAWWLSQFEYMPIIGEWITQITEQVEKTQNQ